MRLPTTKLDNSHFYWQRGFTLMEVLVATAITGIAIGVCMAIFAQGHSQAFRGMQAKVAYQIAVQLIDSWKAKKQFPSDESGQLETNPGWSYLVESGPVSAKITSSDGSVRTIETDDLKEIVLKIVPPDKKRTFTLTFWVPVKEVEGSER